MSGIVGLVCPHLGERQELPCLLGLCLQAHGPWPPSCLPSPEDPAGMSAECHPHIEGFSPQTSVVRPRHTGWLARSSRNRSGTSFTRWVPAQQAKVNGGHRWPSPLGAALVDGARRTARDSSSYSARGHNDAPPVTRHFSSAPTGRMTLLRAGRPTSRATHLIFTRRRSGDRLGRDYPILSSDCHGLIVASYTHAHFSLVKAFIYLYHFHATPFMSLKCPIRWR